VRNFPGDCLKTEQNNVNQKINNLHTSVIILNYNGARFLKKLFKSLSNQTFKDFEVIFVDNKSTDNSLQLLREILSNRALKHLRVKTVKSNKNIGYCKGNNVGLKLTSSKYVVFLNNDTYVSKTWLEELVKVMETHPSIGACQSRLVKPQTNNIQSDGLFLDVYGWPQGIIFRKNNPAVSRIPFYVSGASMIIRKSALKKTGRFDEELFYGDFDLCWRLRLQGYHVAVALNSACYHLGSVATKMLFPLFKSVYHRYREILRVFLKNYSSRNLLKRAPLSVALALIEAAFLSFRYKQPVFLSTPLQAVIWNLKMLKNTLMARYQIQMARKVFDNEIEKAMLRYSVLLARKWTVEIP